MEFSKLHLYRFKNRQDAGRQLSLHLADYKGSSAHILALPRGGVVVGYELSNKLKLPLDVLIVKKLGHPNNPELGMGAITELGGPYFDRDIMKISGLNKSNLKYTIDKAKKEIGNRKALYRNGHSLQDIDNRDIIIVDDGIATGVTSMAAIDGLRQKGAKKIILAVPVCASDTALKLESYADELICLIKVENLGAIGNFYDDFSQITDDRVVEILNKVKTTVV